jgi:transcriptional regulator with XRE-family HTH domain
MPVRTRILETARQRARSVRLEAGSEIRRSRMASGLPLRVVSASVGRSASWLSRVERGRVSTVSLEDLVVVGAAAGIRVWLGTDPRQTTQRRTRSAEGADRVLRLERQGH